MDIQKNEDIQLDFPEDYQNRFHIFYDLMQYTVKDVLLVSSLYDDFILEEDGGLSEEIYTVYSKLNLSFPPPRILRVPSGVDAIEALKRRHFDLIITMRRLSDFDLISFSEKIREITIDTPIVLLLTNYSEIPNLPSSEHLKHIDKIFVYNGDTDLFLAIIKLVEDLVNVQYDTKIGNVRVIIVIEDTIQYYSIFLPIIFKELLRQTEKSVEEGVNYSHKLLKRRGRPKILLAETFEEAMDYYQKYKLNVLGIISDIAFPRDGTKDFSAGYDIASLMKSENQHLPIILQSSDPENYALAQKLGVKFVHKNSPDYLRTIRRFFATSMLFGDFRFIDLSDKVIATADSLVKFEKILSTIPSEIIERHGSRNDFSNWLFARGEHQIAEKLAPHAASEFNDGNEIKQFILQTFKDRRREDQKSVIIEFNEDLFSIDPDFIKVGKGSLGGKGRGLAFIRTLLNRENIGPNFLDIDISVPETIVVCTDIFDEFIEENDLFDRIFVDHLEDDLDELFISKPLPEKLNVVLELIIDNWEAPLAVRSSSILEDSQFQPFAGIYKTYMIPNDQPDRELRLQLLKNAIKLVYSSTYSKLARTYVKSLGQRIEVEKMAIVIQKIVGNKHGDRYYPDFSGVAKSYNFYPVSYQNAEDGVSELAIGLGEHIVSGGKTLSFSPKHPKMLPQVSNPEYALKSTQTEFFSL
ncbi:MAG: PEP/pyruvate-binding domain-containing protein, partial [Candidatus Kariarchaeaceae archaeon]